MEGIHQMYGEEMHAPDAHLIWHNNCLMLAKSDVCKGSLSRLPMGAPKYLCDTNYDTNMADMAVCVLTKEK